MLGNPLLDYSNDSVCGAGVICLVMSLSRDKFNRAYR